MRCSWYKTAGDGSRASVRARGPTVVSACCCATPAPRTWSSPRAWLATLGRARAEARGGAARARARRASSTCAPAARAGRGGRRRARRPRHGGARVCSPTSTRTRARSRAGRLALRRAHRLVCASPSTPRACRSRSAGLRTIFNAFHHFRPETARGIVADAAAAAPADRDLRDRRPRARADARHRSGAAHVRARAAVPAPVPLGSGCRSRTSCRSCRCSCCGTDSCRACACTRPRAARAGRLARAATPRCVPLGDRPDPAAGPARPRDLSRRRAALGSERLRRARPAARADAGRRATAPCASGSSRSRSRRSPPGPRAPSDPPAPPWPKTARVRAERLVRGRQEEAEPEARHERQHLGPVP